MAVNMTALQISVRLRRISIQRFEEACFFRQQLLGLDRFGFGFGFFVVAVGDENGDVHRERGRRGGVRRDVQARNKLRALSPPCRASAARARAGCDAAGRWARVEQVAPQVVRRLSVPGCWFLEGRPLWRPCFQTRTRRRASLQNFCALYPSACQKQARIRFIVLDRGVVRPLFQHLGENAVDLPGVAALLGEAEPALLRGAHARVFPNDCFVGGRRRSRSRRFSPRNRPG